MSGMQYHCQTDNNTCVLEVEQECNFFALSSESSELEATILAVVKWLPEALAKSGMSRKGTFVQYDRHLNFLSGFFP